MGSVGWSGCDLPQSGALLGWLRTWVLVLLALGASPLSVFAGYGSWATTGALQLGRVDAPSVVLGNGKVLAIGGYMGSGTRSTSCELYDPATGLWTATGSLNVGRSDCTALVLPNGKVLVAGGSGAPELASSELYDPSTGTWAVTGSLNTARAGASLVLLSNGLVLIAGGGNGATALASAELYNSSTGVWIATGSLNAARVQRNGKLLKSGKVLLAGGEGPGGAVMASCELYDPATGTWSTTGTLATARMNAGSVVLPNGRFLIVGGYDGVSPSFSSCELYDPEAGTWSGTGSISEATQLNGMVALLPNGKALRVGGGAFSDYYATAELYDSATGLWTATGSMGTARKANILQVLQNGNAVVAGGYLSGGIINSAEVLTPDYSADSPVVTTQPASSTVTSGGSVTMSVGAIGGSLTYQWRKRGEAVVSTFAGISGSAGTDNGAISSATFNQPRYIARDSSGNFYVTERFSHAIRKISTDGNITLFAGSITEAGSTDGTGVAARFNVPEGIATDSTGNVYVFESGSNVLRKITPSGEVSTLAGSAGASGAEDGTGSAAHFGGPVGSLVVDSTGNIYMADGGNNTIRKITASGVVTTIAGTAGVRGSADGTGTAATFDGMYGIALDSSGNLYVSQFDPNVIRKITPSGVVTTLVGVANQYGHTDGVGSLARLWNPVGLAVDAVGNIYFCDCENRTLRQITPDGTVTTIAGAVGVQASINGSGLSARFQAPFGMTSDAAGNLYVVDSLDHTIRKIELGTNIAGATSATYTIPATSVGDAGSYECVVTNLVGSVVSDAATVTVSSSGGGSGSQAPTITTQPLSTTVTSGGSVSLSVAATGSGLSYQWRKRGEAVVSTLAGSGTPGADDGLGTAASFGGGFFGDCPSIAVDIAGNVYVADSGNNKIRKITSSGYVTTLAGSGEFGSADGIGLAASFHSPQGVAVDIAGNVYVADWGNSKIRKITSSGDVTTIAGSGDSGFADGMGLAASFCCPTGVAVDRAENVYVADGQWIRKITSSGDVTTLAGDGSSRYADGMGLTASFNHIYGVAVDGNGNVYAADAGKIRKITSAGVVTTLAGSGEIGSADGMGLAASFDVLTGVAVDGNGTVYVADPFNRKIRKITNSGDVTTLAGYYSFMEESIDGNATVAFFRFPSGIAVDASGDVYVADNGIPKIRKITTGSNIPGATSATYTIPQVTVGDAGQYDCLITSSGGAQTGSAPVSIVVYTPPTITTQPQGATVAAGNIASLNVTATGQGTLAYQWRKNGTELSGAIGAHYSFVISGLNDAGRYDCVVTDGLGGLSRTTSTVVVTVPCTIRLRPVDVSSGQGGSTVLNVWAKGSGTLTYQWRKLVPKSVVAVAGTGTPGFQNGEPGATSFATPYGVAVDSTGIVYVADTDNHAIRRLALNGTVSTLAGSGEKGRADGAGTDASFRKPNGIAVDSSGIVYVADTSNHLIRKITADGIVSTLAGGATAGSADGRGTAAAFQYPSALAVDSVGNLYVADTFNCKIRKITPEGDVTTFAGSGSYGNTDGTGTGASFNYPAGITLDVLDNIYVADNFNNSVRKITKAGVVTTLAGSGAAGTKDGVGMTASFNSPQGIAADSMGNIYVSDTDGNKIRKVTSGGTVTTLAGAGKLGDKDDVAANATFRGPAGLAVDPSGNVYVADSRNHRIRKVALAQILEGGTASVCKISGKVAANAIGYECVVTDSTGIVATATTPKAGVDGVVLRVAASGLGELSYQWRNRGASSVSTFAGSGTAGNVDGNGTAAAFGYPYGLAVDLSGNVFVTDSVNANLRKISPAGEVTTLAGSGVAGSADGIGLGASFRYPYGIALDWNGNLIVADTGNRKIRQVTPTGVVTTVAGSGIVGTTDGMGQEASFIGPWSVAVDKSGSLFVADIIAGNIRKITADGLVSTFAGSGVGESTDGVGTAAAFTRPAGVGVDAVGNVYVVDMAAHNVRKITPEGITSTLAGSGQMGGKDGKPKEASFKLPYGIAVDGNGDVYVSDNYDQKIRKVDFDGNVSTFVGSGVRGKDDGTAATFDRPQGVALDFVGNVYVADSGNRVIRKITLWDDIAGATSDSYTVAGVRAVKASDYECVVTNGVVASANAAPELSLATVRGESGGNRSGSIADLPAPTEAGWTGLDAKLSAEALGAVLVTAEKSGQGAISGVPANGMVSVGTTVQLKAAPAKDWVFRRYDVWVSGREKQTVLTPKLAMKIPADTWISAVFERSPFRFVGNIPVTLSGWLGDWTDLTGSDVRAPMSVVSVTVSRTGAISGRLAFGHESLPFAGAFGAGDKSEIRFADWLPLEKGADGKLGQTRVSRGLAFEVSERDGIPVLTVGASWLTAGDTALRYPLISELGQLLPPPNGLKTARYLQDLAELNPPSLGGSLRIETTLNGVVTVAGNQANGDGFTASGRIHTASEAEQAWGGLWDLEGPVLGASGLMATSVNPLTVLVLDLRFGRNTPEENGLGALGRYRSERWSRDNRQKIFKESDARDFWSAGISNKAQSNSNFQVK